MEKYQVGIIGATGMVGQRLITLLQDHPWFEIKALAASSKSAGKTYEEALGTRWVMKTPMPDFIKTMKVYDAFEDVKKVTEQVDFVFCAVNLPKEEVLKLEEMYAKAECPVMSNNSANRWTKDVPMIIPELNPDHAQVIEQQKKRLGTKRGFIAVKSNCSIQSYTPALYVLDQKYKVKKILACTYQAISGAGKTFERWPEMVDNLIPYIGGEEEKSEKEPLRVWGKVTEDGIQPAAEPEITAQCLRVPVSDGHMAAVFASFETKPDLEEIKKIWKEYQGEPQKLNLPTAPKQFLNYFEEPDRPQTKLDRDLEKGMAISMGRLRYDTQYDIKFVCLSHNTLRGAAGGGVEMAELLCAKGYISKK